ncbi:UDP-N-acetylmuramoyl-L-alanyl-D-glutamate--2,6-diaminopimelate ligase [Aureicoccus marinus]|uniref:UDP-N-acetylmuramoyl-L-alanyl-D-glutamate--2,6-diaminopimelate ligase n=1 Tax=Aureicoccus marinus TaxID=754435 RepID=A0A2S7T7Q1_9FLAO|nr:UDP-N-acetylmuramoyl-L-alanyl-D-glutamate--2,6-diaminopimelate ligase [Aureicoccus marinus]PQJ15694.1 UDP-N-acetylmuramoyl-L-alanyl-D-glutamate--2,6-diaminopimelate ligase [Aureicoccus marinus]
MKVLRDILYGVSLDAVSGDTAVEIAEVQFDSRRVGDQDVFVAVRGLVSDGHDFIGKALELGARAIVCEEVPEQTVEGVTYVQVKHSATALSVMAANFYDNPSKNLKLVGVTGTNGKTTTTTLLHELFHSAGYSVGLISTIKVLVGTKEYPATHTTPDPLSINKYLSMMCGAGVEFCFMEVSSHGIDQKRIEGLHFAGAVFTNLTHDHLDYHGSFAAYRDTKKRLFDQLPKTAFALVNTDDKNGLVMMQNTRARKLTYALKGYADYRAQVLESQFNGQLIKLDDNELWSKLIGQFNAYNLLAIYAVADQLGLDKIETLRLISELETVDGRFQYFISPQKIQAIVDYAHTPDALKNVLVTISALRTGNENVITVVGCGGDRDQSKRPVMGHIASEFSDKVIFTSDNPRSEPPRSIMDQMEAGVEIQNKKKVLMIEDRREAIKTACSLAQDGDIVLVAGKGHETYQEVQGVRTEFDDYKEIIQILSN